jgi:hypothetical protein
MVSMRLLAITLLAAACAPGLRATPETRYQGWMLNARTLGAEELRGEMARDETVRRFVERYGQPDFVYVGGPTDVELVYVHPDSRLVHFHRAEAGGPSTVSELSPLPLEVTNVLEIDLRAGTPGDIMEKGPPKTNCWTVDVQGGRCRTCCLTVEACATDCSR